MQCALIQDNCTFKESLTQDLKPPLVLDTKGALNFGPSIGRRVTLSAKLISSNNMKSASNSTKQKKEFHFLKKLHYMIHYGMKSATMKVPIMIEIIPSPMKI